MFNIVSLFGHCHSQLHARFAIHRVSSHSPSTTHMVASTSRCDDPYPKGTGTMIFTLTHTKM